MKKNYQIIGLFLLILCSAIFDFNKPMQLTDNKYELDCYVYLEGAFLHQGIYEFQSGLTIGELVEKVGVDKNANLAALKMNAYVLDESCLYLPYKNDLCVSLNNADKEELMTLKRIGEKTAQKIIEYRNEKSFIYIEDIKNIAGIGEKTFLMIRDYICL